MGFLSILGTPLGWVMSFFYDLLVKINAVGAYGWSLVIFIVIIRAAMFPLTIKQQKSTARMAAFQPKLKQLQKQYAKDKNRYQQEMMSLYEQEGISPAAGCLPMAVQTILLFGIIDVIYNPLKHLLHFPADAITNATEILTKTGQVSAPQLSIISQIAAGSTEYNSVFTADQLSQIRNFDMNFLGFNMGAIPNQVWGIIIIIPILSFLSQIGYTLISMQQQKQNGMGQQGMMKWFILLMPLLSLWFAFTMPAGVGFYWTLSNVLMIAQQLLVQKLYPPEKVVATEDRSTRKAREKLKKQREKMAEYTQKMAEQGKGPDGKPLPADANKQKKTEPIETAKEKELAKKRLAEARKRMAEKYGEDYKEDE